MQNLPAKHGRRNTVSVRRGCFQSHASGTTSDLALEAVQAHQQSRRTAGQAKSLIETLNHSDTSQQSPSWNLQWSGKTQPFLPGKKKIPLPFLLIVRIAGFMKNPAAQPSFPPSLCVVTACHNLSPVVYYLANCARDKAEAACSHGEGRWLVNTMAWCVSNIIYSMKHIWNENLVCVQSKRQTPRFEPVYLRKVYFIDLQNWRMRHSFFIIYRFAFLE